MASMLFGIALRFWFLTINLGKLNLHRETLAATRSLALGFGLCLLAIPFIVL